MKIYHRDTAEEVDVERPLPLIRLCVLQAGQRREGTVVEDQTVDPAKRRGGELNKLAGRL